MMRKWTLLSLISTFVTTYAAEPSRRSFLKAGGAIAVAPMVPAVPISVPAKASAAQAACRVQEVYKLLHRNVHSTVNGQGLRIGDQALEILHDWQKQDPVSRAFIDQEVSEHNQRIERFQYTSDPAELERQFRTGKESRDRVFSHVQEGPWNTWDSNRIFASRLAEAELEVAHELNVDPVRAHALLEQMIAARPANRSATTLVEALGDYSYSEETAPLYSEHTVDLMLTKISKFAPLLAEELRQANADLMPLNLRYQIVQTSGFMHQISGTNPPIQYAFEHRYAWNSFYDQAKSADDLLPGYKEAFDYLNEFKRRTQKLDPSILKDELLVQTEELSKQLVEELRTLPLRFAELKKFNLARHSGQAYAGPTSFEWTSATEISEQIRWLSLLRGLSQQLPKVVNLRGASPAASRAPGELTTSWI